MLTPSQSKMVAKKERSDSFEAEMSIYPDPLESARDSSNSSMLLRRAVYMYAGIHGSSDQLFPACYKVLESHLQLTPTVLGTASSFSRLAHAFISPFWGIIVDGWDGVSVMAFSALVWGTCTALLGTMSSEWQLLPLMVMCGLAMAAMGPVTQKLLADTTSQQQRGRSFGNMQFFQSFGRMCSLILGTGLSTAIVLGLYGWRWGFICLGLISIAFSSYVFLKFVNIQFLTSTTSLSIKQGISIIGVNIIELQYVFTNTSFWIMLVLGVLNGMPRSALNFITMWFQYCGLNDWLASTTVSVSWLTAMLVAPFVGRVGDYVHQHYPDRGRPAMAQLAIIVRAFLMFILLKYVPQNADSVYTFMTLSAAIGFMAGWPGVGVNRPILTEIVQPKHRATVFGLVSTMEGIGSALLGAPFVGLLAQHVFGYILPPTAKSGIKHKVDLSSQSQEIQENNARALGNALMLTTVTPWILSVFVYFILFKTYKIDREAARTRMEVHEENDIECGIITDQTLSSEQRVGNRKKSTSPGTSTWESRSDTSDTELVIKNQNIPFKQFFKSKISKHQYDRLDDSMDMPDTPDLIIPSLAMHVTDDYDQSVANNLRKI